MSLTSQVKKCFICKNPISSQSVIREAELDGVLHLFCSQRCEQAFSINPTSNPTSQSNSATLDDTNPIQRYLQQAADFNGSDLFLSVGEKPTLRVGPDFKILEQTVLNDKTLSSFLEKILTPKKMEEFYAGSDVDIALDGPDKTRFRINIFRHFKGIAMVVRMLRDQIHSFQELGLPNALEQLLFSKQGLILVTGATGSGKTTTLASCINTINEKLECHIISLEDPIEYIIPNKRSLIHQREVGKHVSSFADGLKSALRECPDVIVIGEMRDLESITWALRAAETGHLVLATLHSSTASQTITRLIDVFDSSRQQQIRIQLAESLLGVCSQKILPRKDKKGMIVATEVLINTLAISNLIRMNNLHSIPGYIETDTEHHMHSFKQSIRDLIEKELVAAEWKE